MYNIYPRIIKLSNTNPGRSYVAPNKKLGKHMYIRSPDWHIWRSDDSPHGSFVEHKGKQINQPRRNVEPAKLLERKKKANISLIESHGWLQSFISFAGSRLKEVVIIPGPPLKKPRGTPGQACHAETSLTKCGEITWYWRHHFSPPTPPGG